MRLRRWCGRWSTGTASPRPPTLLDQRCGRRRRGGTPRPNSLPRSRPGHSPRDRHRPQLLVPPGHASAVACTGTGPGTVPVVGRDEPLPSQVPSRAHTGGGSVPSVARACTRRTARAAPTTRLPPPPPVPVFSVRPQPLGRGRPVPGTACPAPPALSGRAGPGAGQLMKGQVPPAASSPPARGAPMTRGAERSTCAMQGRQWTPYGGGTTWKSPSRWPSGGGPRVPWSGGPRSSGMWAGSRRTGPSWTQRGPWPSTSSGAPPWASSLGRCGASYPPSAWQRNWAACHPQCSPSTGSWHEAPRPPLPRPD